jgi:isoquinoline 1-oxidoreductase subunit beta
MTSLPLILAEEMDADWQKVKIEFAPADADIFGYTFQNQRMMAIVGSRAVQLYYPQLRMAGAQVRKVLIQNAAAKWGVDAATLKTEPGVVVNPANGQRLGYGEIAAFGTVPATLPTVDAKELKARKDFRLIGKTIPRRDTPLKVNGSAQYAIDVRLPGMVYATALHAPVHTGQPQSWNDAEIKKMPGVLATVRLPNGIGIVAEHFEQAMAARNALKATWNDGAAAGFDSGKAEGADDRARQEGRRCSRLRRRRQDLQGGVPQRLRLPCPDGAAERGGADRRRGRQGGGVGGQPGARRDA